MKRIAIVYSSHSGQTDRIAGFMARYLSCYGHVVTTFNIRRGPVPSEFALSAFDQVIIGGPVYYGEFNEQLLDWANGNSDRLNRMTLGVFSVSLHAASKREKSRRKSASFAAKLASMTSLRPDNVTDLGGAARYTRLGLFAKLALRMFCNQAGLKALSYEDKEFTDWRQVEQFLCAMLNCDVPSQSIMRALAGAPMPGDASVPYAA